LVEFVLIEVVDIVTSELCGCCLEFFCESFEEVLVSSQPYLRGEGDAKKK
jgi:hypothetical protein